MMQIHCTCPNCGHHYADVRNGRLPDQRIQNNITAANDPNYRLRTAIEDATAKLTTAMELLAQSMKENRNG